MSDSFPNDHTIFNHAIELASDAERSDYLDDVCEGDCQQRNRIEELLNAHMEAGSFLWGKSEISTPTEIRPVIEQPGDLIGPYKLREQIGEGGFGVVYVAEQEKPVARKVALKVIKPGMDTKSVIARFEAERQALAMMDHPNIAKVFDAGTTETGRPYFVMELVHGLPITEFCDQRKLINRERLAIFVDVCRAVQHAHQKGIIHRDLKPSNIMVTLDDDRPVPKVIDFGVSKALIGKLTDKTVYTAYGQMVGTPLYMAPEQAALTLLDVDTRSDVYSLGVLLYELLTGATPFDGETLKNVSFDELRRIIREDEPPRPSARISTLKAELITTACDRRHIDRRSLGNSLRGELDWIVMKALEKDRNRRYESASAFAMDVDRHLNDEHVQASPPNFGYRFRKLVRKHRAAFTVFTCSCALMISLTIAAFALAANARQTAKHEREKAKQQITDNREARNALAELRSYVQRIEKQWPTDDEIWSLARAAASRLQTLAGSDLLDASLAKEIESTLNSHGQIESNREFWKDLDGIRLKTVDAVQDSSLDFARQPHPKSLGFQAVLAKHGFDPKTLSPQQAAEKLNNYPDRIRLGMIAALDAWRIYDDAIKSVKQKPKDQKLDAEDFRQPEQRTVDEPGAQWRDKLLDLIDQDPWRRRARLAIQTNDRKELVTLGKTAEVESTPTYTLLLVGTTLANQIFDADQFRIGIDLLRKAHRAHPEDFWIAAELPVCMGRQLGTVFSVSESERERLRAESVVYASVAASLRPDDASTLLRLTGCLYRAGRKEEASVVLQRAAKHADPSDHESLVRLAEWFHLLGKPDQGLSLLRRVEISPQMDLDWYIRASRLFHELDADGEARKAMRNARDLAHDVDDHLRLAIASRIQGFYDDALVNCRVALKISGHRRLVADNHPRIRQFTPETSTYLTIHEELIRDLLALNRQSEAVAFVQAATQEHEEPFNLVFEKFLADRYFWTKQWKLAAASYGKVIEKGLPHFERDRWPWSIYANEPYSIWDARAIAFEKLGQDVEALAAWKTATQLSPNYANGYFRLGLACQRQSKFAEATEAFETCICLDPSHFEAHFELAKMLRTKGERREADSLLHQAAEVCPNRYSAHNKLGIEFRSAGLLDAAQSEFEECLAIDPALGAAPFNLAGLYLQVNMPEKALSLMDKREVTWPVIRGPALLKLGRIDEAIECLRRGLDEYQSKPGRIRSCRFHLAHALQAKAVTLCLPADISPDDLKAAEVYARDSIRLTTGRGDRAWAVLALVQYRLGSEQDAIQSLQKAMKLNSSNRIALLVQAVIYWKQGNQSKARMSLSKAQSAFLTSSTVDATDLQLKASVEDLIEKAALN